MPDQADQLRELVRQRATLALTNGPSIVVIAGCRGGVGSTTVALELSLALAALQLRVVLVDADLEHAALSRKVLPADGGTAGLADVLAGRRTATEVLRPGPRGIRLLPSACSATQVPSVSLHACDRLTHELLRLGERTDVIVVDTAGGLTPWSERFWQVAQRVLVVTTTDGTAVAAMYALLQLAHGAGLMSAVRLVVNRCPSPEVSDQIHQRLGQASFRYLGELLQALPPLPSIDVVQGHGRQPSQQPVSDLAFHRAIQLVARNLMSDLRPTSAAKVAQGADVETADILLPRAGRVESGRLASVDAALAPCAGTRINPGEKFVKL